jgi:hypothetical protein
MNTKWNFQRWFNVLITLELVILLFGEWQYRNPEAKQMTIVNSRTSDIYFGAIPALDNLTTMTVVVWAKVSSFNSNPNNIDIVAMKGLPVSSTYGWYFAMGDTQDGHLRFYQRRATTVGSWKTNNGTISTGTMYLVAVTYDSSSTANDPIFYINGSASATTKSSTPAGAVSDDSAGHIDIGDFSDTLTANATIPVFRIYNRILSVAEILSIYESRGCDNIYNGLVFAPVLYGAAGLQSFDGATITSSNKIVDPISGALGTAYGSPTGLAETYLCATP